MSAGTSGEPTETLTETILFKIDEAQSTASTKHIVRQRIVKHEKDTKRWTEVFEDTFTVALADLNLGQLCSNTVNTSHSATGTPFICSVGLITC